MIPRLKKRLSQLINWLSPRLAPAHLSGVERALRSKTISQVQWQIAQAEPGTDYPCGEDPTGSTLYCSFAPSVIASAQGFVREQETSHPRWDAWVKEWSTRERDK